MSSLKFGPNLNVNGYIDGNVFINGTSGFKGTATFGENGTASIKRATALLSAMSGATVTSTGLIPDGALVLGVQVYVVTLITGATSFKIGDGSDDDLWGATIAVTAGTATTGANFTAAAAGGYIATSAGDVVLTAAGSNFTAGAVRIVVNYIDFQAMTA